MGAVVGVYDDVNEPILALGRLRGYRVWRVSDLGGEGDPELVLRSVTQNTVWPWTPYYTARCPLTADLADKRARIAAMFAVPEAWLGPEHGPIPGKLCSCGIYAKVDPHELLDYSKDGDLTVLGAIDAWGRLELGKDGRIFRAANARIVALHLRRLYVPEPVKEEKPRLPSIRDLRPGEGFTIEPVRYGRMVWTQQVEVEWSEAEALRDVIATQLGTRYRVPIYDSRQSLISDYPPSDVSSLKE